MRIKSSAAMLTLAVAASGRVETPSVPIEIVVQSPPLVSRRASMTLFELAALRVNRKARRKARMRLRKRRGWR